MKRSGRASVVVVVLVIGMVVVLVAAFSAGESPTTVGSRFMAALADGNADTLADLSIMGDESKDQMKKDWEKTLHDGAYYRFKYRIKASEEPGPDQASVMIAVERNYKPDGTSYEENYQLPMHKVDGKWKVDVFSMSRQVYPWLPR